jgi:hypothetical protein
MARAKRDQGLTAHASLINQHRLQTDLDEGRDDRDAVLINC